MKKLILLILFVTIVSHAQWVQISTGMGNQTIPSLVCGGNNIFAGTNYNGVYLSIDNGTNWTQTSLNNRTIFSLALNENNVYAGTGGGGYGVYISTNSGASWTQTSLNNRTIYSLAVNGNNVFAGTALNGVYVSTNNGTNWTQTSLNNKDVWSLAINGNNVYAATGQNSGLYVSTNNGTNWTQTSLNNISIYSLAVNGNNIFAGSILNGGLYLSTNNGTNWTQTSLNNISIYSLAVNGNNVFVGTQTDGVYVSNNNGTIWTQKSEGLGNRTVAAICMLNNYIFAGKYDSSVYRRALNELIGIKSISNEIPIQFFLSQNYPNPFNPITKIQFALPKSSFTTLIIYDALGSELETLVNEVLKSGTYEAEWNADKYSSGIYFYSLLTDGVTLTKKMILIK